MNRVVFWTRKSGCPAIVVIVIMFAAWGICFGSDSSAKKHSLSDYEKWAAVGRFAADTSLNLISKAVSVPQTGDLIVLTNAGYAEVDGVPTQGALDGVASITGVSRGKKTLIEIHSASWKPLWFGVYDQGSGICAYLEVNSSEAAKMIECPATTPPVEVFSIRASERIDAGYLYQHAAEYKAKFEDKVFGGNEFRIITIANAVAAHAPASAVRAFEFHDHYCPGVISGILMANYLKAHFPPGKSGYFVHAVTPWCKEDALMVLLNATPGKRSYAVSYPTAADVGDRVPKAKNAATIVYRQDGQTKRWEGVILEFEWAATSCPKTGNGVIDKLYVDLWYLGYMEKPEAFVKVIKAFELPEGVSPADWARPGIDPLKMLGLIRE